MTDREIKLNEVQIEMLKQLLFWCGWDNCWHSYYHFEDILKD